MNTFIVCLELDLLGQILTSNIEVYLKSHATWAKPFNNVWIIRTSKNTGTVRDELRAIVSLSKIMVVDITKSGWATANITKAITDWMKNNI